MTRGRPDRQQRRRAGHRRRPPAGRRRWRARRRRPAAPRGRRRRRRRPRPAAVLPPVRGRDRVRPRRRSWARPRHSSERPAEPPARSSTRPRLESAAAPVAVPLGAAGAGRDRPGASGRAFRVDGATIRVRRPADAAGALTEFEAGPRPRSTYAIRERDRCSAAPAIGQAAALGMALTADARPRPRGRTRGGRSCGRPNAMRNAARPTLGRRAAMDAGDGRATSRSASCPRTATGSPHAMQAEADAIVVEAIDRPRPRSPRRRRRSSPGCPGRDAARCGSSRPRARRADRGRPVRDGAGRSRPPHHQREIPIWVDVPEGRPYLDGRAVSCWELAQAGVPHTARRRRRPRRSLMPSARSTSSSSAPNAIAANGDVANDVGTYPLAVARRPARRAGHRLRAAAAWTRRPRTAPRSRSGSRRRGASGSAVASATPRRHPPGSRVIPGRDRGRHPGPSASTALARPRAARGRRRSRRARRWPTARRA